MADRCSFSGYRPHKLPDGGDPSSLRIRELYEKTRLAVIDAIEDGCREFMCGMALGFDLMCGEIVLSMKGVAPVRLIAVVPHGQQSERFEREDKLHYDRVLYRCDEVILLSPHYKQGCYHKRNRYLVDHADRLIVYYNGIPGGTENTVRYALLKGKTVINIADQITGD